jgi:hypothetical protein
MSHDFDAEGVCALCGFDGAEWHYWRYQTHEGRAKPEAKIPRCVTQQEREYAEAMRQGPTLEEWSEIDRIDK